MTIPVWVLLLFAAWALLLLFGTVEFFRWSRILTGRARIQEWRANEDQGTDWYKRVMRRASAQCALSRVTRKRYARSEPFTGQHNHRIVRIEHWPTSAEGIWMAH